MKKDVLLIVLASVASICSFSYNPDNKNKKSTKVINMSSYKFFVSDSGIAEFNADIIASKVIKADVTFKLQRLINDKWRTITVDSVTIENKRIFYCGRAKINPSGIYRGLIRVMVLNDGKKSEYITKFLY